MKELDKIKKVLLSAVQEAGDLALSQFGKINSNDVKYKGKNKTAPVTSVDIKIDTLIRENILSNFPDHDIISEEKETLNNSGDIIWIIDPIDGTRNYINGNENYNVSVGIIINKEIYFGAIYAPSLNKFYFTQKGKGLYINGKKFEPSKDKTNIVLTGKKKFQSQHKQIELVKNMTPKYFGAAALELAFVAQGLADAAIYNNIMIWDIVAGILMVEEVGGKLYDFNGNPYNFNSTSLLAIR